MNEIYRNVGLAKSTCGSSVKKALCLDGHYQRWSETLRRIYIRQVRVKNLRRPLEMLNFLRPLYPNAYVTLHASELAPGIVPPEGLTFHIRDSMVKGHAERIGHGVAVMHEDNLYGLLKEMWKLEEEFKHFESQY